MITQLGLETVKTILEREMMYLSVNSKTDETETIEPPKNGNPLSDRTMVEHRMYLAGLIDGFFISGRISEQTRTELYSEYAF